MNRRGIKVTVPAKNQVLQNWFATHFGSVATMKELLPKKKGKPVVIGLQSKLLKEAYEKAEKED